MKKSVIVAGGTDCVSFPSIHYGNFSNKRNRFFTKFSFKNASLILPVHESLVEYNYTYQNKDYPKQGLKYFIPGIKTKIVTIYNGYDSSYWHNKVVKKEAKSFVTVLGHLNSRFTIRLKGIDLFIELCRKFPGSTFTIVGGKDIKLESMPPNLILLPTVWGEKLVDLFSSKQFYVQLSISEGFPNALCEAMLCECIPIVSAVGGMPDIVDDCGYILNEKNIDLLEKLVSTALLNEDLKDLGLKARNRVKENYSLEKRRTAFLNEITKLMNGD